MSLSLYTPSEMAAQIAGRVRLERLARGWTQAELAARSAVALPTYRLFERTGQISLERLISISITLTRHAEWSSIFRPRPYQSLDDVDPPGPRRQRGTRKKRKN